MQPKFVLHLCFFVYFEMLWDDGFPMEQKGFVRATVSPIIHSRLVHSRVFHSRGVYKHQKLKNAKKNYGKWRRKTITVCDWRPILAIHPSTRSLQSNRKRVFCNGAKRKTYKQTDFSCLALTAWERQYFDDIFTMSMSMDDWWTHLIN